MILEVENYTSLEALADDILDALKKHPVDITRKDKPLKIELSQKNYDTVQGDLMSYGSAEGVRTVDDYKYNTWQVGGEYVAFTIKKIDGDISDK
tara:strand:- start:6336 stop:6617 length:282 start_codon:yes stop_codon:yes gene_type:complete